MQFNISDNTISINQSLYINNILTRFNMQDCTPKTLPCPTDLYKLMKFTKPKPLSDKKQYQELIGSLVYLMYCSRPDICFIVGILSRFMSDPLDIHMKIARNLLRYIKGTIHFDLKYTKSNDSLNIVGYADSDFAAGVDRKSISGYCFRMNKESALISWRSRKQRLVADSTCECEFVALAETTKTGLFNSSFISELTQTPRITVIIFADNKSSIARAQNPSYSDATRHIDVKYHLVRDYVAQKLIEVHYVPSAENIADIFTKPLTAVQLTRFACMRGQFSNVEGGSVDVQRVNYCKARCHCVYRYCNIFNQ